MADDLVEQIELAFDEFDEREPWRISGVDPETGEVVSDRVRREDALGALDRDE